MEIYQTYTDKDFGITIFYNISAGTVTTTCQTNTDMVGFYKKLKTAKKQEDEHK